MGDWRTRVVGSVQVKFSNTRWEESGRVVLGLQDSLQLPTGAQTSREGGEGWPPKQSQCLCHAYPGSEQDVQPRSIPQGTESGGSKAPSAQGSVPIFSATDCQRSVGKLDLPIVGWEKVECTQNQVVL